MTQSSLLMLSWATCGDDGHWCDFLRLKLDSDSLSKSLREPGGGHPA
jgi:hypothetical protein